MKFRSGFVTNSSSSSFICQICGNEHSGWDATLRDAYMVECKNGHVFCQDHLIDKNKVDKEDDDYPYGVNTKHCPICQFKEMNETDALKFLMKDVGLTKEVILATIQGRFGTYDKFKKFLGEK